MTVKRHYDVAWCTVHCPKTNMNVGIKTGSVATGAYATGYVWFLGQIYVNKRQTYTAGSGPAVASLVFMHRFRLLFLGQCSVDAASV